MRALSLKAASIAVVAAAMALAGCAGGEVAEPSIFDGLGDHETLEAAKSAASADGNLVLVDFYTDW